VPAPGDGFVVKLHGKTRYKAAMVGRRARGKVTQPTRCHPERSRAIRGSALRGRVRSFDSSLRSSLRMTGLIGWAEVWGDEAGGRELRAIVVSHP
jgi:hypothetical protein